MKMLRAAVFLLLFLAFTKSVGAQYDDISIPTQGITPTPSVTPKAVHYDLPYPGILPGNPLYSLKALRDKFMEILTADPSKKTNFYLLQADKRLAASLLLFDSGKHELGEQTLSKSQNYLEESINEVGAARGMNENVDEVAEKLQVSSKKQIEEINKLLPKEKGQTKENLKAELKRANMLEERAEHLGQ